MRRLYHQEALDHLLCLIAGQKMTVSSDLRGVKGGSGRREGGREGGRKGREGWMKTKSKGEREREGMNERERERREHWSCMNLHHQAPFTTTVLS